MGCLVCRLQVVVFSWSGCPFCKNAKALLSDVGADFTALELDTMGQEGKAIRAELAQVGKREGPVEGSVCTLQSIAERTAGGGGLAV